MTAVEARGVGPARRQLKLPGRIIEAQIDAAARDLEVGAVKVGCLPSWQMVETVARRLRRRHLQNAVLHPGIIDAEGARVLGARGAAAVRTGLFPRSRVVVLNRDEAGLLAEQAIGSWDDAMEAAVRLRAMGVEAVLITGLPGPRLCLEQEGGASAFDWADGELGTRHAGVLTAAITARLALGVTVQDAVAFAVQFAVNAANAPGVGDTLPGRADDADILDEK